MRAAFVYYLVQAWAADPHRHARREASAAAGEIRAQTLRRPLRRVWAHRRVVSDRAEHVPEPVVPRQTRSALTWSAEVTSERTTP